MFLPLAGASLSVLKVEIGGGAFTSDGAEASHAYTAADRSPHRFDRGYEWWLMKEARRRNPQIALYGLPWSWPGWIGGGGSGSDDGGGGSPWANLSLPVGYIVDWVRGAKEVHNLTIDWVGDWNETPVDWDYNILLRAALDAAGFRHVRICASDQGNGWAVPANSTQLAVIDAVGAHYPAVHGGPPPADEFARLSDASIPMWASEDGAGTPFISSTWARTVNQNYAVLNISSTIAWNLLTSYDDDLPYVSLPRRPTCHLVGCTCGEKQHLLVIWSRFPNIVCHCIV
jgi:galactosylceramidase